MTESEAPTVFLLVGLTGSGKTTYAQRVLEPGGAVRLSVDEVVFERHGRYGVDYPENTYFGKEAPVVAELHRRLAELVAEGRDVWDHAVAATGAEAFTSRRPACLRRRAAPHPPPGARRPP